MHTNSRSQQRYQAFNKYLSARSNKIKNGCLVFSTLVAFIVFLNYIFSSSEMNLQPFYTATAAKDDIASWGGDCLRKILTATTGKQDSLADCINVDNLILPNISHQIKDISPVLTEPSANNQWIAGYRVTEIMPVKIPDPQNSNSTVISTQEITTQYRFNILSINNRYRILNKPYQLNDDRVGENCEIDYLTTVDTNSVFAKNVVEQFFSAYLLGQRPLDRIVSSDSPIVALTPIRYKSFVVKEIKSDSTIEDTLGKDLKKPINIYVTLIARDFNDQETMHQYPLEVISENLIYVISTISQNILIQE